MASDYHFAFPGDPDLTPRPGLCAIYGLWCPLSDDLRYVGKARNPRRRLTDHLTKAHQGGDSHKTRWLRKLGSLGVEPEMRVLLWVPNQEWPAAEMACIVWARALGCPLTNATAGGWTVVPHTPEQRRKMADTRRGKPTGATQRARCSQAQRKRWALLDSAARERILQVLAIARRKPHTPERRAANAARQKGRPGRPASDETKARMSAAQKERQEEGMSEQSRARLSASLKKRAATPEHRAKMAPIVAANSSNPVERARRSRAALAQWQDPRHHANVSAKTSARLKAHFSDPIARAKQSAMVKGLWQDPEYRARMLATRAEKRRAPAARNTGGADE